MNVKKNIYFNYNFFLRKKLKIEKIVCFNMFKIECFDYLGFWILVRYNVNWKFMYFLKIVVLMLVFGF